MARLRSEGQPGVGDAFLKWVLTNVTNPRYCETVHISPRDADGEGYMEYPDTEELAAFDSSDRKFVAVALAHPARPPILNAVDTDWWRFREALERHGVQIDFLCMDAMSPTRH